MIETGPRSTWGRLELFIPGIPQPQGSKEYKGLRYGKPILVESNAITLGPWRDKIAMMTRAYCRGRRLEMALQMESLFIMPRPKGHFGKHGNLLPSAPLYPDVMPDLDKLLRAIDDGLATGGAMRTDAQIVCHLSTKLYGLKPGVHLILQTYPAAFSPLTATQVALSLPGPDAE